MENPFDKKMKRSELIQKLIEIEVEEGKGATITINYIEYLKTLKRYSEQEDIEI